MANDGRYEFASEVRAAYEALNVPMAIYQFIKDKCVTLLVTDGLCKLLGRDRAVLTYQFDTDMFGNLHPDDVETLANLGLHYAISGTNYDTVIRVQRPDGNGYMRIHTTARPAIMEGGIRIDFFTYADVTDINMGIMRSIETTAEPKGKFLDENVSAVAVISKRYNILLYCNNAMKSILPPKVNFDSGISFNDYFYPDFPGGIHELSPVPEDGVYTVTDPRAGKRLNVNVSSCAWRGEPCHALYFYELLENPGDALSDNRLLTPANGDGLTLRKAFDTAIYSGSYSEHPITSPEYRGFCVWNVETGELAASSGEHCLAAQFGRGLKYDDYLLAVTDHLDSMRSEVAANWNSSSLVQGFKFDTYVRSMTLPLRVENELVPLKVGAVLMRSPDNHCLYARFSEENVADRLIEKSVLMNAVAYEFEFVAYINAHADRCRVFYGQTSNETEKDVSARLGEYYPIIANMIGQDPYNLKEFLRYLEEECAGGSQSVHVLEIPGGRFKSVRILAVDQAEKLYYLTRIDVTDTVLRERMREKELTAAKEKAEEATTSVQRFLSSVSHDLRTPLNGIIGYADLALKEESSEKKQEYLKKIALSGELMLDLVNDVLDTSKIESGQLELVPQTIDTRVLLEGIKGSVSLLAEKKGIRFHYTVDTDCPKYILADRLKLQQIALNLLSNAIKYTQEGGDVWFETKMLATLVSGCNMRIMVKDTGIGMSEKFQTRMFEPFSQERQREYAGVQGTGLGLFIVHKIVELMGGKIDVESAVGQGTTFTVYLPIESADHGEDGAPVAVLTPCISGSRILLAEDNNMNAEIATAILSQRGKTLVERAVNGEEAFNKFAHSEPGYFNAILMDLRMPVMDGLSATQAIRALRRPDAREIPIIAMTADAFAEDVEACLKAGMNSHISKPIDPDAMIKKLAENMNKSFEVRA